MGKYSSFELLWDSGTVTSGTRLPKQCSSDLKDLPYSTMSPSTLYKTSSYFY